jgi:hypothetical protein
MSHISHEISRAIAPADVELREFGDLVIALMDRGVICREDSPAEKELYDRYMRCKPMLHDYLDVMGIGVLHNEDFASVRVYAPDANYPGGLPPEEPSSQMRFSVNADLSAALIICFLLHKQHAAEGRQQEDYSVVVNRDEFYTAHATLLAYDPRPNKTARDEVVRALGRLKAVTYHSDFFDNDEYPIIIRPLIYDIVLEEAVQATLERLSNGEENA